MLNISHPNAAGLFSYNSSVGKISSSPGAFSGLAPSCNIASESITKNKSAMKQKLFFASAMSALFMFAACKKSDPSPVNPTPVTEKKLKKVTKTEAGATTVYNITYDAAGRLLSYKSTDNKEFVQLTYDAAGNLVKLEQQDADVRNVYTYAYVNNIPVNGTQKSWDISGGLPGTLNEDNVLDYTVSNNQVSKIKMTMLGAVEINYILTYTNGNLTRVAGDGMFPVITEITYGTKKPVYPRAINWVLDPAGYSLQFTARNEVTRVFLDFPGTANDETVNIAYTYDAAGYALTSNDGSSQQTFEYQ